MLEPSGGATSTEPTKAGATSPSATAKPADSKPLAGNAAAKGKPNPAFAAMGLPNMRLKLPSRNWMIFLSIVGSWTGTLVYDRTQKKKVQKKWCTLVEHVAQEAIPTNQILRKVTVILAAPPGDGLNTARQHFREYVRPILVAGAMDWDVIEGRREGDVRAGLAERIRRVRRKNGEFAETSVEIDVVAAIEGVRARTGVYQVQGVEGDIIIGRHTWKEYVRGLHEGWLGSIDPPKEVEAAKPVVPAPMETALLDLSVGTTPRGLSEDVSQESPLNGDAARDSDDASPTAHVEPPKEEKKEEPQKPKKPPVAPPHNTPDSYAATPLPPSIPSELQPATAIPFPHVLGFLKTPIRIYRFLTRRILADDVGRQTAAAVLAAYRPWQDDSGAAANGDDSAGNSSSDRRHWEQEDVLLEEEQYWQKKTRERREGEGERVWLDKVVVDPRIGQRMRKFEVEPWEEERARAIWKGSKGLPGRREGLSEFEESRRT